MRKFTITLRDGSEVIHEAESLHIDDRFVAFVTFHEDRQETALYYAVDTVTKIVDEAK
jgi:hypothetical protein